MRICLGSPVTTFFNRKIKSKDNVEMYIRDNIQFNLREDLCIFIENLNLCLLNPLLPAKLLLLEKCFVFPPQMLLYLSNDMSRKVQTTSKQIIIGTEFFC